MHRIGIVGPESTGKTTLGKQIAERNNGIFIPEYARTYVERLHRDYSFEDVIRIANRQREELTHPQKLFGKSVLYVYDTELIITKVWLKHKYHTYPEWIDDVLADNLIDLYLICYPDIPFVQDAVRENPHLREYLFELYLKEVKRLHTPYQIICGEIRSTYKLPF